MARRGRAGSSPEASPEVAFGFVCPPEYTLGVNSPCRTGQTFVQVAKAAKVAKDEALLSPGRLDAIDNLISHHLLSPGLAHVNPHRLRGIAGLLDGARTRSEVREAVAVADAASHSRRSPRLAGLPTEAQPGLTWGGPVRKRPGTSPEASPTCAAPHVPPPRACSVSSPPWRDGRFVRQRQVERGERMPSPSPPKYQDIDAAVSAHAKPPLRQP